MGKLELQLQAPEAGAIWDSSLTAGTMCFSSDKHALSVYSAQEATLSFGLMPGWGGGMQDFAW